MRSSRRASWPSIALTVLFVAWLMGWLPWLASAAAVIGAVVAGAAWYEQRQDRLAAIAARADQQHAWVMAGDPRGTYGWRPLDTGT